MARKPTTDPTKRGKYSELLVGWGELIAADFVRELKMDAELARRASGIALEVIRANAGGGGLYVAKGHLFGITEKHRRIYRKFTGANHAQLAREFDLTERQIYSIIAMVGQEEFERKQCKLFE